MQTRPIRTVTASIAVVGALALAACQPADPQSQLAQTDAKPAEPMTGPRPLPGQQSVRPTDDAAIVARVSSALRSDAQLGGVEIDVQADRGVVTLTGAVPDPKKRERAVLIARSVMGVTEVQENFS
jgi:osmotically-inducible protein OsmY